MPVLTIWLKTIQAGNLTTAGSTISANDLAMVQAALPFGSAELKRYLRQIIGVAGLGGSYSAEVKLEPNDDQIGGGDLLVYLTTSSLARAFATSFNYTLPPTHGPSGLTVNFPEGVVSEIYIPTIRDHGRDDTQRGKVLANLAIHEIAHNKCCREPTIPDPNDYVHANGGGGVLAERLMPGTLHVDLNATNISFMARRIGRQVPQLTSYLFSSRLGF